MFGALGRLLDAAVEVVTLPITVVSDVMSGEDDTKKSLKKAASKLVEAVETFPD